jgi:divalent metal cation (Fe/Co/Zn/Cd) transporter
MDRVPPIPVEAIGEAAARASGVAETRRVRVRGTPDQLFADVTVAAGRTSSLERAHDIAERVEKEIELVVPGADVVVHVEPIAETTGLVERVQAAASRVGRVREIHNVAVHAFDEGGKPKLHVTLHAKVDGSTSIAQAHSVADDVEQMIVEELGDHVRVDAHIEPLERTAVGRDVTEERADVVGSVRELTQAEADIVDCHEILVTSSNAALSIVVHVRARGDLPLARIHDASERVENGLHARHPDVGEVLIHFEPA